MEHMMPINRPVALLISFYSGYEVADKAISVSKQVQVIWYRFPVTSENKYDIDIAAQVLYKDLMAALA